MGEKNWMKKVVFFTDEDKLKDALNIFNIESFKGKIIPFKLHMGELRNKFFVKPSFVKHVVDVLKSFNIDVFLFDTTVAYSGLRSTKQGYEKLAKVHGFPQKVGCKVVIDDIGVPVKVDGREYEVAEHLFNATHIFALSHVKGHIAAGMGGAIKNFGMGGVTRETKRRMHNWCKPRYICDNCVFCGICTEVCPFDAIHVKKDKKLWRWDEKACFGCGVCVENCKSDALQYVDADLQYSLACAAKACVQGKKVIYLNELKRIAKKCDCHPSAGPVICPDIGYLVSDDPVAVDKASLDLINKVKPDVFKKENKVDPYKQIKYGEEIGLGSSSYRLIEI